MPIHPLRLCKEVRDFIDRDAILVVDGQEILNFGRQTIPTFAPGHRMNSGVFGTMGVGLPLGVGAKLAAPDKQVVVLHGDGSFGMNAMEFDTAVRHGVPVLVVISQNGGWTGDPDRAKPGRDLGYPRYDEIALDPRRARRARRGARRHPAGPGARRRRHRRGQAGAGQRGHRLARARHHGAVHAVHDLIAGSQRGPRAAARHRRSGRARVRLPRLRGLLHGARTAPDFEPAIV